MNGDDTPLLVFLLAIQMADAIIDAALVVALVFAGLAVVVGAITTWSVHRG